MKCTLKFCTCLLSFHASDCILQDVDQYLLLDNRKDAEVESVQLENIKLKNKLKKQEAQLKSKVCYLLQLYK